ncbi:hypothetical protein WN944_022845 [Citrus x changshan-huyou]|uniref:GDSL esterase/lipase n=1 Tax=Citrus x changshan-huyou TaxID=2935761 RepID=A0AAP0N519_9ROSI
MAITISFQLQPGPINYLPYGIDFPTGRAGRFSNGRNMVDILADLLGFDNPIPSFATTSGLDILKGVNYASGSSGIRDETGQHLGAGINMNNQLLNHQYIESGIVNMSGDKESATLYNYGARKVVLFGLAPLGCTLPNMAIDGTNNGSSCVDFINRADREGFHQGGLARAEYLWWDGTHPTEAGNLMVARRSYSSQFPSDTYTIDMHGQAQL